MNSAAAHQQRLAAEARRRAYESLDNGIADGALEPSFVRLRIQAREGVRRDVAERDKRVAAAVRSRQINSLTLGTYL